MLAIKVEECLTGSAELDTARCMPAFKQGLATDCAVSTAAVAFHENGGLVRCLAVGQIGSNVLELQTMRFTE